MIWPVLWSLETFWGQQLPLVLPSLGKEMAVVWMAIMMWVTEAEGWCWWDLWTPWPPSPGNFQEAKAYLHVLGQQRSPSTMSALCHAKCRVLLWSRLELLCGADTVIKRLASMLSGKFDCEYAAMLNWLKCRTSFALFRSTIMALRGSRRRLPTPSGQPALALAESRLSHAN